MISQHHEQQYFRKGQEKQAELYFQETALFIFTLFEQQTLTADILKENPKQYQYPLITYIYKYVYLHPTVHYFNLKTKQKNVTSTLLYMHEFLFFRKKS